MAAEFIRLNGGLWGEVDRIGRWWDRNEEINIVGLNENKNIILFGEVKWSKNPVGSEVLRQLKEKARKVLWGNSKTEKRFVIFSFKGFTEELIRQAREERVILVREDKIIAGRTN